MEIEIKAKKLETVINKLGKQSARIEELNGRLQNPITLEDIKDLLNYYSKKATALKTAGLGKTIDCYNALVCSVSSWYGNLPKAYKYKKEYIYASISCKENEFSLRICRVECYSGNWVSRFGLFVKGTKLVKEKAQFIISNLLGD